MSALAVPLFWCAVQVTLLTAATLAMHAGAGRILRFSPVSIGIGGLTMIIGLTCLAFSPWPRWPTLHAPLEAVFSAAPAVQVTPDAIPDRTGPSGETASASRIPSSTAPVAANQPVAYRGSRVPAPGSRPGVNGISIALVLIGFSAALLGLLRFAWGLWAVRDFVQRSRPVTDRNTLEELDVLQAELDLPQEVGLRESGDLLTAATVGWRRPVILLPHGWTAWTRDELHAVLAHELAHIRNHDYPAWLAAQAALILHFYNPLVHWLAAGLRLDQELAADAIAARLAGGEKFYLRLLADIALRQADAPLNWPVRAFLPTRGTFMRRIEMLRDTTTRRPARTSLAVRGGALSLLFSVGLLVAGLRPVQSIAAPESFAQALHTQAAFGEPELSQLPLALPVSDEDSDVISGSSGSELPVLVAQNDSEKKQGEGEQDSDFQSADEAFGVGAAYYNSRNYAKSRAPFEAALKLAPDDDYRLKVYRALIPSYRLLPEIDKMLTATEFVLEHGTQVAEKSLMTRSLVSFVFERGKSDEVIKRYEDRLQKDPKNRTALTVLSQIYVDIKRDPKKGGELVERLAALDKEENKPFDVQQSAQLAMQYVRAKKHKDGAELYEKLAPLDEKLAAWHWKEAATAWLKAGDKARALEAAKKSAASRPETRSDLLTYFWHRGLADAFLDAGDASAAIPHFEKALEKTDIDGYLKSSRERLEEARKKAASD